MLKDRKILYFHNEQNGLLRGEMEGEILMLSEGPSVKGSLEDKQSPYPYIRGSANISRRVTPDLYTRKTPMAVKMET